MFTFSEYFNSKWHTMFTFDDLSALVLTANKLKARHKNNHYAIISAETGEIIFEI